jgi:hypothetical protein
MSLKENLPSALSQAQAEMLEVKESGYNPHFKSNFSTLTDLIRASRPALTKYGLSITQYPHSQDGVTYLVTKMLHASGEAIVGQVAIYLKDHTDIQKLGSAISYLKRYAYAAICGLSTSESDDDGNSLSEQQQPRQSYTPQQNNASASEFISSKQAYFLKQVMAKSEGLEQKVLQAYGIASMEQFPWKKVKELKEKLGIVDEDK